MVVSHFVQNLCQNRLQQNKLTLQITQMGTWTVPG